jgi:hypothetical protein
MRCAVRRGLVALIGVAALTATACGKAGSHITGPDTKPVTMFEPDQTKLMHFYLIRSDLSGYQHVHPSMAADGTWTATLAALTRGTYRAYASFTTPDAMSKPIAFVLSVPVPVTVPGAATTSPVPATAPTTTVDGYTLTLSGQPMAGMAHTMTLHVTRNGRPVTDLQPYLDTYAHLSAFHAGNLAFAHPHPSGAVNGDHGRRVHRPCRLTRVSRMRVAPGRTELGRLSFAWSATLDAMGNEASDDHVGRQATHDTRHLHG